MLTENGSDEQKFNKKEMTYNGICNCSVLTKSYEKLQQSKNCSQFWNLFFNWKKKLHFFFLILKKRLNAPWNGTNSFKFSVAIDFGTEGTAMAITNNKTRDTTRISDWNSSGVSDSKESNGKTRTALLLDQDRRVIAFGNEAYNKSLLMNFLF
ncbi:hypothetical protein RFI_32920 [Reticulomyxa filosa]|uniref:Uncharacterized protein n=1 Tax=Reticulomyxa filosa TaxID=46433 RepID=X6LRI5_RETFI|nr:hypothetical protein RFI_32920 [Reticulomyxa filosa]|eukprot:ETO04478.1 hypothetical protein RFI_32920 [Reticulomyxa filosa]